jgi:hypothetical protein
MSKEYYSDLQLTSFQIKIRVANDNRRCCCLSLLIWLLLSLSGRAFAQDHDSIQAAAIFQQTCILYTGHPAPIRRWAQAHGLTAMTPEKSKGFAQRNDAVAFGLSVGGSKMALVSVDDGACKLVIQAADLANVESALASILAQSEIRVLETYDHSKPLPPTQQRMYRAAIGPRRWLLSVTSHTHDDAPGMLPEITLLATPDDGKPLAGRF